ncbi:hypothetical protein EXT48_06620 [Pseudoalteromonas sp. CO348]|uniref:DsrH/TusB family sulfur metabolism protein n=1 Tax=unclassified Pseudoalteromonas TaxID=194690 RepID=UPI001023A616|nr:MULTISPECIES: DsrH/TusB family sulfur metabolism protein [unclassified Pseudoalteromonas]MCG7539984.1 hypothetical protein [Pseudoalteromonas sp. OF7H-1]RZG07284.1 hypothetical protein EXT48_06620 [Pseudoalteromonas sp. CO348]
MSTLHIISSIEACDQLQFVSHHDTILLCNDGCFGQTRISAGDANVVMLQTCACARGIVPEAGVELISDKDWVELTITMNNSITW